MTEDAERSAKRQLQVQIGREDVAFQDTLVAALCGQADSEELLAPSGRRYLVRRAPERGIAFRLTGEQPGGAWTRMTRFVAGDERPADFPADGPLVRGATVLMFETSERPGEVAYILGKSLRHSDSAESGANARQPVQQAAVDVFAQLRRREGTPELEALNAVVEQYEATGTGDRRAELGDPAWRDRMEGLLSALGVDISAVAKALVPDPARVGEARQITSAVLEQSVAEGWHVEHEETSSALMGSDRWRLTRSGTVRDITLTLIPPEPTVIVKDSQSTQISERLVQPKL